MTNRNFLYHTIFIFCFTFFICSVYRSFDPDLWGHLKFGEYIFTTQSLPIKDFYSFVETKSLWINHEWLSEVIFYLLISLQSSGLFLLLFKALTLTTAIMIPWFYINRESKTSIFNLIVYVIIILSFSYGTAIRPQIFSYLFFSITLLILEHYKLKGVKSYIFLLIIFILWVNLHGGVIAGLCVVYFYAAFSFIKSFNDSKTSKEKLFSAKYFIIPVSLSFTLLITPYTFNYIPYITEAILLKRPFVEEWQSMFYSLSFYLYTIILMLLGIALLILNYHNYNKEKLFHAVLLILLALVCIKHSRHIPFFAITCAFYLPAFTESIVTVFTKNKAYTKTALFNYIISILLLIMSFVYVVQTFMRGYHLEIKEVSSSLYTGYPVNTAHFIKRHGLKGNMVTNFNWGEFIIYYLSPDIKISFDGRFETVYPDHIVKDNLTFINAKEGWKSVLKEFNPDFILISKYDPIYEKLLNNNEWLIIFEDYEGILFVSIDKIKIKR